MVASPPPWRTSGGQLELFGSIQENGMRERRPADWRIDLAQLHPVEAEVGRALDDHP